MAELNLVESFIETLPEVAAVADTTPPTVTYTLPSGSRISPKASIFVSINDESGVFHNIALYVRWPLAKQGIPSEIVWSTSGGFEPFYKNASIATRTLTGYDLQVTRKDDWPTTPSFTADVVDTGGNRPS